MGVMKAAVIVGSFTLLSRIIGFLRECLMVFCLGAGIYTDALLVALRLANTFRRIFAEGAFNSSFLPRFSRVLNIEGKKKANEVLSDIFVALIVIISIFCIIILLFFPSILRLILSGFDELSEKFKLTVVLGRICFPYLLFISIASLFSGVLNTINKFALPAALHSILSLFTMLGLIIGYYCNFSHMITVHIISVFVLLSGITQSFILFSSVKNSGFYLKLRFNFWSEKVKDIMKNMIPGIIGAGVWQLNLLVDTTISSYLPTGTITCINLADRLNQFPLGTLGIALSTALLPVLSKHISKKDYRAASYELERGLIFAFFFTCFSTTLFISLSEQTVAVAFQRGLFENEQVRITADAVVGFSIGLPAYVLTKVFSSVYFACGDTKTPVIFGAISVFLNIIFLISI
ncbi:MAG: murein biosynthesis integral membrane protein MurJ, partial [Alphaproteobacteria bacterium]|nr:murein biosynthesis integral membrane protein MurJ [Alphaproteobacteria bacterium]